MTNESNIVRFEKITDLAQLALKILVLVNGGAAVALLAFIGSNWSPYYNASLTIIFLASGLGAFSLGVLSGAIAALSAYHAGNYNLFNNNDLSNKYARRTRIAVRASLLLFFIGIVASIAAIFV